MLLYLGQTTYPDKFPCADDTWTYMAESGDCYKIASDTLRYVWASAESTCQGLLSKYSAVQVRVVETHDLSEADALRDFLVKRAIKEKVWLGATRTCKLV